MAGSAVVAIVTSLVTVMGRSPAVAVQYYTPAADGAPLGRSCSITPMRIAIVGGPGVGKSTLRAAARGPLSQRARTEKVRRASGIRACSATSSSGRNAVGVTAYFADLYDANYRDAAAHDAPGRVIFIEGARITLEAHIAEYPVHEHARLHEVLRRGDDWNPDRLIVLTSSTDTVDKHIRLRNRPHESAENMVRRFRLIDGEFRRLAPRTPTPWCSTATAGSSTSGRRCSRSFPLAGLPPFREIRYRGYD